MLTPGSQVDRYRIQKHLGAGAVAEVYLARHTTLGTRHAIKVLTPEAKSQAGRLVIEGRVQSNLRHPNVVAVTDVIEVGDRPALVLEFIDGPSLDRWLLTHRPSLEEALALFRGIVCGVGAAHAVGLIHRDLKPGNVLLSVESNGVVPKVADFGLVKTNAGVTRTRVGTTMGTPAYMAPEQIRDASSVDRRADLYSLGVILYELVCGRPPFIDADLLALFSKVATSDYPPPNELVPGLPNAIVDCIESMMCLDLQHRTPDCATVLELLDNSGAVPATGMWLTEDGAGLPSPREMPANPGPASLTPNSPGAAAASAFVMRDEPGLAAVELDAAAVEPTRPDASAAPPASARRSWVLPAIAVLLLTTFVGLGVLAAAGVLGVVLWPSSPATTVTLAPVLPPAVPTPPEPPEPPEVPAPSVAPEPPAAVPTPPRPPGPKPASVSIAPEPSAPVPAPAPVAEPTPAPEPKPAPQKAAVPLKIRRDADTADAWIADATRKRYRSGDSVPAGTYTLSAAFEGPDGVRQVDFKTPVTADPGKTLEIICVAAQALCKVR